MEVPFDLLTYAKSSASRLYHWCKYYTYIKCICIWAVSLKQILYIHKVYLHLGCIIDANILQKLHLHQGAISLMKIYYIVCICIRALSLMQILCINCICIIWAVSFCKYSAWTASSSSGLYQWCTYSAWTASVLWLYPVPNKLNYTFRFL